MSKKRTLTSDEEALWAHVTRSVEPLQPSNTAARKTHSPLTPSSSKPQKLGTNPTPKTIAPQSSSHPKRSGVRSTAPKQSAKPLLDPRTLRKLRKGQVQATLDLHGMTQAQAHSALKGFIARCRQRGLKTVIVVTGKGANDYSPFGQGRGVLKRQVPQWLSSPPLSNEIVGFNEASPRHGGEGALYVVLRARVKG